MRGSFADPHHGESFGQVTVAEFPTGSASISALPTTQKRQLDIAESFIKSAGVKMDLIGHTDHAGAMGGNLSLSQDRAAAVKAELVRRGISASRFFWRRRVWVRRNVQRRAINLPVAKLIFSCSIRQAAA